MEYNFKEIEQQWQSFWAQHKTYQTINGGDKPKYYVLDMFPYPSGAGLHVGHPLGYIASDIVARYKRLKGFNVLHPMGFDSFGLPAEQYAIQTGQHPAVTTDQNIKRYLEQLNKIGFSFDWERAVRTSDPAYYKWTQWIFLQLFGAWYNPISIKAEPIETLIAQFEKAGSAPGVHGSEFSAQEWNGFTEERQQEILMHYRMAYLGEAFVNWCPALGTVLANDEVKDGVSERGGHPVERKLMKQWSMRITAYADRLLNGLDKLDWTESLKESQRYWIGKSEGASLRFQVDNSTASIEVFTTRPDTVFGVSFITLAPEHDLVAELTMPEQKASVEEYVVMAKARSERERMADVKKVTGVFTGSFVVHPFSGKRIPIWIGDYVLAGYGTGAVMAVPAHDSRDYAFAQHFHMPIIEVISGGDISVEAYEAKEGVLVNSDFLNGLDVKQALKKIIGEIEARNLGKGKVNFRLRDAVFGRQRYWGEPIPIYYKNGIPYPLKESELPLILPEVDKFLPTETGEPPLARAKDWKYEGKYDYEHTTMPGWAGSSWYYLRYMDALNPEAFVSKEASAYWNQVDLYLGGSEHATGHLLYVRFWTMALKDLGFLTFEEPAQKLINQGMIQGRSLKPLVGKGKHKGLFSADWVQKLSKEEKNDFHLGTNFPIEYADEKDRITPEKLAWIYQQDPYLKEIFRESDFNWQKDAEGNAYFTFENEVEKMSKSKRNVVTPDLICEQYGADCLRLYEMFLGPLEQSKPWNTNGISGVSGFLKKLWRLYHTADAQFRVSDEVPTKAELKVLHKTIKKIHDDIERFSFNTSVSNFMICVNELTDLKCNKRAILEPLAILISPYAPHITETLWALLQLGEGFSLEKIPASYKSINTAIWPEFKAEYLVDDAFAYPVSFNGKMKFKLELPLTLDIQEVEAAAMSHADTQAQLGGKQPKKVIVVHNKIVNIVV